MEEKNIDVNDAPEVKEEPKKEEPKKVEPEVEKTPTQYRVERAERQTEERILAELGVESLTDALDKLKRVEELEKKYEKITTEVTLASKKTKLKQVLEEHDVFDADVLVPFVNIEELDSDEDYINAVKALQESKPKHFGVKKIVGDVHKESKEIERNPIKEAEAKGDYHGAIANWLASME